MNAIPNVMPNVLNNVFNNVNPGVFGGLGPELMQDWDMEQYGPELMVDGDMEKIGTADWIALRSTLSKETSDPVSGIQSLKILSTSFSPFAYQSAKLPGTGMMVNYTGYAKTDGVIDASVGYGSGVPVTTGKPIVWTPFDVAFVESSVNLGLSGNGGGIGNFVGFDDVSARLDKSTTWAWTANSGAVLTKVAGSPSGSGTLVLDVETLTGDFASQAYQNVLAIGKMYRVSGYARTDGVATSARITAGDAETHVVATSDVWQWFSLDLISDGTLLRLKCFTDSTADASCQFDNISIKEIL